MRLFRYKEVYIDPATGYVVLAAVSWLLSAVAGVLGVVGAIVAATMKKLRVYLIAVTVLAILSTCGWWGYQAYWHHTKPIGRRIIVLGIDGMDPDRTQHLLDAGRLPRLQSLIASGTFDPLETTNPPQSPVAWASFATGLNPEHHGIHDFIARQLDYSLGLSFSPVGEDGKLQSPYDAHSFYDYLSQHHVNQRLIGMPLAYPAPRITGKVLGGMGVPDLLGTQGTFTLVGTAEYNTPLTSGRYIQINHADEITFDLPGPKASDDDGPETVPVTLQHSVNGTISIAVEDQIEILKTGIFSNWIEADFGHGQGIFRARLQTTEPDLLIYLTPLHISPKSESLATSYPKDYAEELAAGHGLFHISGMPYDTWALSLGALSDGAFLDQADYLHTERRDITLAELEEFNDGVFFAYFEGIDMLQHMFWRYLDTQHALYAQHTTYAEVIDHAYEKVDVVIGAVMEQLAVDDILLIVSDHGSADFRTSVNLNDWLASRGYLVRLDNSQPVDAGLGNIDWHQTVAYAAGFSGIYLNVVDREEDGFVDANEYDDLRRVLSQELKRWKDPATNNPVVSSVVLPESEGWSGPDIQVGFQNAYRASWQTALGAGSGTGEENLLQPNLRKWSGDHLIDPKIVPGVIISNQRWRLDKPEIIDIAPTILKLAGLSDSEIETYQLDGRPLF